MTAKCIIIITIIKINATYFTHIHMHAHYIDKHIYMHTLRFFFRMCKESTSIWKYMLSYITWVHMDSYLWLPLWVHDGLCCSAQACSCPLPLLSLCSSLPVSPPVCRGCSRMPRPCCPTEATTASQASRACRTASRGWQRDPGRGQVGPAHRHTV